MYALMSILVWGVSIVLSVAFFIPALLLFLLTFWWDPNRRILHYYTCVWGASYAFINPLLRVRVEDRERLKIKGARIFVCNHQSLYDISVIFHLFTHLKWIAKKSLFRIPFVGWNMTMNGYINLDREDRKSQEKMLNKSIAYLNRGSSLMIFPEGTRTPDGAIKRFKGGAFKLAFDTMTPVVPLVIDGSFQAVPKHGVFMKHAQKIIIKVLDPVFPKDFDSYRSLRDHVRQLMENAYAELHTRLAPA